MPPILLSHGSGGEESSELISSLFYRYFNNPILAQNEDSAICEISHKIALSLDGYTVSPLFFSGANIGKLAICGTCNDLAMRGAKPRYLTVGCIIEEGFASEQLEEIVKTMADECQKIGVYIVSGDTKVVPKGSADGIYITTSGVGEVIHENIGFHGLKEGMDLIVSSDVGSHGAVIFSTRSGIDLDTNIQSDCRHLYPSVEALLNEGIIPIAMRDATRGGIAAVLNEWAKGAKVEITIQENAIPVQTEVQGVCELLGFDPLSLANEGCFISAFQPHDTQKALKILQQFSPSAAIIGKVTQSHHERVILESAYQTKRLLHMPTGELLPRIC